MGQALQPSDHLHVSPLNPLQLTFLKYGNQNWTQCSKCSLRSAEQTEMISVCSIPYTCSAGLHLPSLLQHPTANSCSAGCPQDPRSLLARLLRSHTDLTDLYWALWWWCPRCRALHLSLLNIIHFLLTHTSSLSRAHKWLSLMRHATHHTVCEGALIPSSRGFMKTLNSNARFLRNIDPTDP